jgi:hypothetical protein
VDDLLDLGAERALFTHSGPEALACKAWTGELLPVDWADGLCDAPRSVHWIGAAP